MLDSCKPDTTPGVIEKLAWAGTWNVAGELPPPPPISRQSFMLSQRDMNTPR